MAANEEVVFSEELVSKYEKNHNEEGFWDKIKKVGTKIGVAPIYLVFLLYHSLISKSIPFVSKAPIAGALGYFISLIDGVPDLTPFVGYCDDVGVVVGALAIVATQITEEIRNQAKSSARKMFPDITDEEFSVIDNMYKKSGEAVNAAKDMKQAKKDTRSKTKKKGK
jgi:uncharacterized membrane protein YkvA (DUF1232 family)